MSSSPPVASSGSREGSWKPLVVSGRSSQARPLLVQKLHQPQVTAPHYSPEAAHKSIYMNHTLFAHSTAFCSTVSIVPRTKTGPCCNQVKKYQLQVCIHQSFATDTTAPTTNFLKHSDLNFEPKWNQIHTQSQAQAKFLLKQRNSSSSIVTSDLSEKVTCVSWFLLRKHCWVGQQNTCPLQVSHSHFSAFFYTSRSFRWFQ